MNIGYGSGWTAALDLQFERAKNRSIVSRCRHNGPLRVQKPFYPEDGVCHIYLLHPHGGVVGGDELPYNEGATPSGGEGLVSTFSDYSKFCQMLLGDGVYKGRRIISSESIDWMTAIATPRFIAGGYDSGFAYGYSLYVLQEPLLAGTGSPADIYGWGGYHNTGFWIDRENQLFGLFMSRTTPHSGEIIKQFRSVVYSVID